jgi:hypothetical protein
MVMVVLETESQAAAFGLFGSILQMHPTKLFGSAELMAVFGKPTILPLHQRLGL